MCRDARYALLSLVGDPSLDHRVFERVEEIATAILNHDGDKAAALREVATLAKQEREEREAAESCHLLALEAAACEAESQYA